MSRGSSIGFEPKEKSPMAPLRVSTTKSEWLPDDPTAFVPTRLWKLPFITTWDDSRNQNRPTDSAEEADNHALLAIFRLQQSSLGGDRHRFGGRAHLQRGVHANRLRDRHLHVLMRGFLEAGS